MNNISQVEQMFFESSARPNPSTTIPYIIAENFPKLGLFAALRFMEWVHENPDGVISLPTGKTPEYFIKWVTHLAANWSDKSLTNLRHEHGLPLKQFPDFRGLHFVQIDEFFPIDPTQHNSFYHYVNEFYLGGFGLDKSRAQLINCDLIPTPNKQTVREIFTDNKVDLSLRFRDCRSSHERLQRETIFAVDQWCAEYEDQIAGKGGIGFFLGGIGPDGHIAFNVRGSDHHSTTRLMETNFETQAAAASDLGGIEISKNRLVITIGLSTITANPGCTAIIIAAGDAKAQIVRDSLESGRDICFPASALERLPNARFYLTRGAASKLTDSVDEYYFSGEWTMEKIITAVVDLCRRINKFGHHLSMDDLRQDKYCGRIPGLDDNTVPEMVAAIKQKIEKGLHWEENEVFYHTAPHHDDIMLGYLPQIIHLVRTPLNQHHFAILTSGFTSVTNQYVIGILENTRDLLSRGQLEMTDYPDFFEEGFKHKRDKDVHHYLNNIAAADAGEQERGLCHRLTRNLVEIYQLKSKGDLSSKISDVLTYLKGCYDGEKNPPEIQRFKGMVREFEEELVWAHLGIQVRSISHLRLGFYTGDIFTEQPDRDRDVQPILRQLREIKPTVISLALDPEGSGPDTHYKVLQAIAEAVREWGEEADLSGLRIWGYRNVWNRFNPGDADIIVPVTLSSMSVLRNMFMESYLSQKEASFPSYELDGSFSELAQKIWVEQYQSLEFVLGKKYWYQNEHPRLRAAHGAIFLKEMSLNEFLAMARQLEKSIEGQIG